MNLKTVDDAELETLPEGSYRLRGSDHVAAALYDLSTDTIERNVPAMRVAQILPPPFFVNAERRAVRQWTRADEMRVAIFVIRQPLTLLAAAEAWQGTLRRLTAAQDQVRAAKETLRDAEQAVRDAEWAHKKALGDLERAGEG